MFSVISKSYLPTRDGGFNIPLGRKAVHLMDQVYDTLFTSRNDFSNFGYQPKLKPVPDPLGDLIEFAGECLDALIEAPFLSIGGTVGNPVWHLLNGVDLMLQHYADNKCESKEKNL